MKKISIIFGSTTGSTEQVADLIKGQLSEADVTVVNVTDAKDEHVKEADLVLFGSSTWGYGELQDDFQGYYDAMNADLLNGKKVAVFGCGDSIGFGDVFCEAVNLITDKATECGAQVVADGLKVDGDVDSNIDAITTFVQSL